MPNALFFYGIGSLNVFDTDDRLWRSVNRSLYGGEFVDEVVAVEVNFNNASHARHLVKKNWFAGVQRTLENPFHLFPLFLLEHQ